ncbi:extensin-like domain-containing protein [Sphingomonas sp. PB4P5]|uniref:extensin-like domain-containing protein n=1 Tax=Parasphingomonas puruogangriensis TaxID=3096155 RepID=UPI002FC9CE8F
MRRIRRVIGWLCALAMLGLAALVLFAITRGRPQDLPWTPLDITQPAGLFTGRKIAALGNDLAACRAQLDRAGVRYTVLPEVTAGQCGYANGVRLTAGGARRIAFAPPGVGLSCPVAAGLSVWEWDVVQPAARRYFGQRVVSIDHYGSYSCRRLYGRSQGDLSEHASANAVDVAGFRLEDGTRVSIIGDWQDQGDKGTFLRAVRTGACDLFATVLSPDYNAAHRDHLHLDQANRGATGWRACR